jgi:hypothetical protein
MFLLLGTMKSLYLPQMPIPAVGNTMKRVIIMVARSWSSQTKFPARASDRLKVSVSASAHQTEIMKARTAGAVGVHKEKNK